MIDHSLLHPTMTDADITHGLHLALTHNVATACIKPYSIPLARQILSPPSSTHSSSSDPASTSIPTPTVGICPVIGFPHGNSTTAVKVFEATSAVRAAAGGSSTDNVVEIDMVVNVGKVLSHDWGYVESEIAQINDAVTRDGGGILKVIFENDYLGDGEIVRLCEICTRVGVAFVKTSTGYGFVKGDDGRYGYAGATARQVRLMREHVGSGVGIKAAGGVRTLDDVLLMRSLGVARVGATATVAILEEARGRGIGEEEVEVEFRAG